MTSSSMPAATSADEKSIPSQTPRIGVRQANALTLWLEQQLQDERTLLMDRHQALCDVMRKNLTSDSVVNLEGSQCIRPPRIAPGLQMSGDQPLSGQGCSEMLHMACGSLEAEGEQSPLSAASATLDLAGGRDVSIALAKGIKGADVHIAVPASFSRESISTIESQHHRDIFKKRKANSLIGIKSVDSEKGRLRGVNVWVRSWNFELFFSSLILMSSAVMALQVQWEGVAVAAQSGFEPVSPQGSDGWPGAAPFFTNIEYVFGILFTLEIVLKIVAYKAEFWKAMWNVLDFIIVVQFLLGLLVDLALPFNPMLLRVCRLIRLLRLLKFLNMFEVFDTLALLVSSIKASVSTCIWCVLLLCVVQMVFALAFNAVLVDHMTDQTGDLQFRVELFKLFGSFTRSTVTMFEVTLGNWVVVCRLLSENVSEWWGLVFIAYKCIVGFAVLKVMTGVFLSQTFKVAAMDDELMIQTKERQEMYFRKKMSKLLRAADVDNVGFINLHQFQAAVEEPRVKLWLQSMDMKVQDASEVFAFIAGDTSFRAGELSLTSEEETVVSVDDLCRGIGQLKGQAQQVDMIALIAHCRHVREELADMRRRMRSESLPSPIVVQTMTC